MDDEGGTRTPRSRSDRRRQQVLEAALEAITERGVPDTRMSDIAVRAGMSPGHVLYYFRSKAHILTELLRWNEDRFHADLRAGLAGTETARERLLHLIRASVPDGPGDPHWLLWLEVWARSPHDPDLFAGRELEERRFQELVASVIRDGQRSGEFDPAIDAFDAAVRLSALIDGLAIHVAIGAPGIDRDAMLGIATAEATSLLGVDVSALS